MFDATSGALASLNREARRIFNDLQTPGRPLEQLLGVLTFRRADGREISLEEFPLAQALRAGETVRAEEIVIQIPDGRSVTTLVNATPIHSEEGEVESVVVTLQDLTPLEDLERLRAEFLGMVSHELQTPLASIRGSAATLLDDEPDLDPAEMRQFHRIIQREASRMRSLISDLLDVARIETGTLPVAPGPAELAALVDEARNAFLSAGGREPAAHRPAAGPALGPGGPAAHRPGAGQPPGQRRQPLAGVLRHPGGRRAGGHSRRGVRHRRGPGRGGGAPAPPVPEVLPQRRRGPGARSGGFGPGLGHLQGDRGGPRGPHLGRERRGRPGGAVHLYHSGGAGGRD